MDGLFRLSGAMQHDPAIDAWLDDRPSALGGIGRTWFERMRACGDDVRELMHDGRATACVGDAAFGYVGVFKAHVGVGFFFGADLGDPAGLLEGTGWNMRHVKVTLARGIDAAALSALIDAAYIDLRWRLGAT